MNILTDNLPLSIMVSGKNLPIDSDFRASIAFETMMCSPDITDVEKPVGMLRLYLPRYANRFDTVTDGDCEEYKHLVAHIDEVVEQLLDFYKGGMPDKVARGGSGKRPERIYAYDFDAAYIFASFRQAYGIDLLDTPLHWWKFKALFYALPEETIIKKIMGYRAGKISSKMSTEEKSHLRKMKSMYALPKYLSLAEKEREDKLAEILMGDGDLSKLDIN